MGTYLYWRCDDHTPPLLSEEDAAQNSRDETIKELRELLEKRDFIIQAWEQNLYPTEIARFNTAKFFVAHPKCEIALEDEYGKTVPLN